MHLHFERTINTSSDSTISSLSWMGKVPDELPEDQSWKLNRVNYYQEGWLATGNAVGIVGVTYSTSHCKRSASLPSRINYNLRGHRSDVILVKWNEPYQKLASCDSSGVIFVWFKYDGRWSIELINDRNTPVTHFSWSHDGKMALICYQDGFVLVGSVAGQRYWSSMLNLDATITAGVWSPDDQLVYFGTTSGHIIVMDIHGAMMGQVQLSSDCGIISMLWFCESFKMEDIEDPSSNEQNTTHEYDNKNSLLAVSLQNGFIYLIKTTDDIYPIKIDVGFCSSNFLMEWNHTKQILAVAGIQSLSRKKNTKLTCENHSCEPEYHNVVKFYNNMGMFLLQYTIPNTQYPITALTWGHNGKRLFLATGKKIHIAWISRKISSLQLLSRFAVYDLIMKESFLYHLPIPIRMRYTISKLFVPTIKCCVPEEKELREFVSKPPLPISSSTRLHCTMIRHGCLSNTYYTLYLEYLGGLFPILKGKRVSKLKPEFVIFDPQESNNSNLIIKNCCSTYTSESDLNTCSKMTPTESCEMPSNTSALMIIDTLPENYRLVHVTSNIWGTKFKMHGLTSTIPSNLGNVIYKASLLHLQPRQMTVIITELNDDVSSLSESSFNTNIFTKDEDIRKITEKSSVDTPTLTSSKYSIVPLIAKLSAVPGRKGSSNEDSSREYNMSLPSLNIKPVIRSYSVGFLDTVDTTSGLNSIPTKRLILTKEGQKKKSNKEIDIDDLLFTICQNRRCNKSISIDISELKAKKLEFNNQNRFTNFNIDKKIVSNKNDMSGKNAIQLSKSVPVTPQPPKKKLNVKNLASTSSSVIKNSFLNSPFLNRKRNNQACKIEITEEDEEDDNDDDDDLEDEQKRKLNADNFINLETFQKTQFMHKFKKCKNYRVYLKNNNKDVTKKSNVFVMQNKAPIWNETSQVYQLDFGGRVTQESAKNFQIEFRDKQVMQFGRIDENTYTLDFQYPFSALQAFSVALANITQRLK